MKTKEEAKVKFLELIEGGEYITCREVRNKGRFNPEGTTKEAWHFGRVEMYQLLDFIYND